MDDENTRLAEMSMKGFSLAHIPGAYWVEYFPFLRYIPSWFPGARFQKIAETYKPFVEGMIQKPYEDVLRGMVGTACNQAWFCHIENVHCFRVKGLLLLL